MSMSRYLSWLPCAHWQKHIIFMRSLRKLNFFALTFLIYERISIRHKNRFQSGERIFRFIDVLRFFFSRHSRSNNILSKLLLLKDANKSQHICKVYSFPCIDVTIRMRIVIAVVNFGDDIDEKDNEPLALSRSLLHYHSFTYSISRHVGCFNCMEVLENYIDSTRHSLEDFQFSVSYSLDGILCMHLITIYHACSFTPTMTITTFTKPSNSSSNNNTEEQKANNKFEMLMLKNIHIIWQSFRIT